MWGVEHAMVSAKQMKPSHTAPITATTTATTTTTRFTADVYYIFM